jgi:NADH-quinone oxidoreductase subunit H
MIRALLFKILLLIIATIKLADRLVGPLLAPILRPLFKISIRVLHSPVLGLLSFSLLISGAVVIVIRQPLMGLIIRVDILPIWTLMWIEIILKIIGLLMLGPICMMYMTWLERKLLGRFQNRYGPNRVGKYGLLQPIADAIKMISKEDIVPVDADRAIHLLAPVIVMAPALLLLSVLPVGDGMSAMPMDVGVLFFFAVSGISGLSVFLAGWASRNKFSLLGGMRSVAQMVAYEVPMLLSLVAVIMVLGSLSTDELVKAQSGMNWFIFTPCGFMGFLLFFVASLAEINRTPFDLPEAESEIVAGFQTEYSGFKFALFYLAEFVSAIAMAGLTVSLFLGGWSTIPVLDKITWLGPFIFLAKTAVLVHVFVWFRGTFPRMRVDQVMSFCWKFLLPLSLINIIVAGVWILILSSGNDWALWMRIAIGWSVGLIILVPSYIWLNRFVGPATVKEREYRFAED